MATQQSVAGRKGPILTWRYSQEEYATASEGEGRCLGCGAEAYGVEPDARKYRCEACGAERVYGLEELLLMGRISVGEEEEGEEGEGSGE